MPTMFMDGTGHKQQAYRYTVLKTIRGYPSSSWILSQFVLQYDDKRTHQTKIGRGTVSSLDSWSLRAININVARRQTHTRGSA